MDEFIKFIKSIIWIDELDLQLVISRCREKRFAKNKRLLRTGQIASQYFFIVSGGVRFVHDYQDKETTTWVMFEQEFFTEISSLHAQKPSRFTIEAVEETKLIVIDKKDMDFLYSQVAAWEEFGRKIWETTTIRMIDQIMNFQTLSAEERYLTFLKNSKLIHNAPVKQIAAVLGITPNALSRIRKKIR